MSEARWYSVVRITRETMLVQAESEEQLRKIVGGEPVDTHRAELIITAPIESALPIYRRLADAVLALEPETKGTTI